MKKLRVAIFALVSSAAIFAQAQDMAKQIDVGAGELTTALKELAVQSGVEFVYSTADLEGIETSGVHGQFTAEKAIEKLLEGTALKVTRHASGALVIALPAGQRTTAQGLGADVPIHPAQADVSGGSADDLAEVVVSGIRMSVEQAQAAKRKASSTIEAITPEDLGKFTDSSIADALRRVPGLNIQNNTQPLSTVGDGVSIRGLGPEFVASTINGRELLGNPGFFGGGSGRTLDFGSIPPDILAGVTIYKAPIASITESGLGGEVNMATLRPLDYALKAGKNFFGNISVGRTFDTHTRDAGAEITNKDNFRKTGPRLSGLIGGKFLNDTLAAYVAGLDSTEHTLQEMAYMYVGQHNINIADEQGNITTLENITTIDGYAPNNSIRKFERNSYVAGVQWKPSDSLELNVDYIDNSFKTDLNNLGNDYYAGFSYFSDPDTVFGPDSHPVIREHQLVSFDSTGITTAPGTPPTYNIAGLSHVLQDKSFKNYGMNLAWNLRDDRQLALDVSHGEAAYFWSWRSPYADNSVAGGTGTVFDGTGNKPIISFKGGVDISDPAQYGNFTYFIFEQLNRSDRDAFSIDFKDRWSDRVGWSVGSRLTRTDVNFVLMQGPNLGPIDPTGFFSGQYDDIPTYPVPIPQVSEAGFCAANPAYCDVTNRGKGSFTGGFPSAQTGKPGDAMLFDPTQSYFLRETKLAFYGQLHSQGTLFNKPFDANAGLRAVRVEERGKAFQGISYQISFGGGQDPNRENETVLAQDKNSYWQYLPSANITLHTTDDTNLRFGIAKTMSLPNYQDLAPIASLTFYAPLAGGAQQPPAFSGGNTRLKPLTAWNLDITGEYYTSYGGAIIASAFYKDVKNLTARIQSLNTTVPGQGDTLFTVSSVANKNDGYSYGLELGTNQPFTFLPAPWSGFGIQANYTYVDSKLNLPTTNEKSTLPGSSKNNVNVSLYYDRNGWSARVALAYRDSYLYSFGSKDASIYTRASTLLDASVSRDIGKHLQLVLTGSNLAGSNDLNYMGSGQLAQGVFQRARMYTLALRGSF